MSMIRADKLEPGCVFIPTWVDQTKLARNPWLCLSNTQCEWAADRCDITCIVNGRLIKTDFTVDLDIKVFD